MPDTVSAATVAEFASDIFRHRILVVVDAETREEVERIAWRNGILPKGEPLRDAGSCVAAATYLMDSGDAIIAFWRDEDWHSIGIMAHEAVHASIWLMQCRGMPVNEDADEVLAYLVEWTTRNLLAALGYDDIIDGGA